MKCLWFVPEPGCFHSFLDKDDVIEILNHGNQLLLISLLPKSKKTVQVRQVEGIPIQIFDGINHCKQILKSEVVIIDGYRLPDQIIVWARKNFCPNSRSIYIQHGRYTELKRMCINSHIVRKFCYYAYFSLVFFGTLIVTKTIVLIQHRFSLRKLLPKSGQFIGLVYEDMDYWIAFHKAKNFTFDTSIAIVDRDFSKFQLSEPNKKYILYCAQTLIEDGRLHETALKEFSLHLSSLSVDLDLPVLIRPHPRSNLQSLKKTFPYASHFPENHIPRPEFMITHSSGIATFFIHHQIPVFYFAINDESIPAGLLDSPFAFFLDSYKLFNSNYIKKCLDDISLQSRSSRPCSLNALTFSRYMNDYLCSTTT